MSFSELGAAAWRYGIGFPYFRSKTRSSNPGLELGDMSQVWPDCLVGLKIGSFRRGGLVVCDRLAQKTNEGDETEAMNVHTIDIHVQR